MDDLVAFLIARLDERVVPVRVPEWHERFCISPDVEDGKCLYCGATEDPAKFSLCAPGEWTLADVAAKRLILDEHTPCHVKTSNDGLNWDYQRCVICEPQDRDLSPGESYWPCPTIRALALPDAGHPDYREQWRP